MLAVKNKAWIFYLLIWILFTGIHISFLILIFNIAALYAIIDGLIFNVIFAVFGSGLFYMLRFSSHKGKSQIEIIINHLIAVAISVALWIGLSYFILQAVFYNNDVYHQFLSDSLVYRIMMGLFYYILIILSFYFTQSNLELKEKIKTEAELKSLLHEAELNMLRTQIKPHFLFNSLNSISSLTLSNPEKAQEMIIKLSEFMRYSLAHSQDITNSFENEMYHINLYLDIEKVRFSNKLKVEFDIDEDVLAFQIPSMILQPLVENSVKHGIYQLSEKVEIKFTAHKKNDGILIIISNSYDPEAISKKGTGTGLINVKKRLYAAYKSDNLMNVHKDENFFTVYIKLPAYEPKKI